ncbi:glycosyltransferase family 4 protein [Escherichia albertii]|nr:glycosyltransferase family 4 protein [Escherichia albertii]
MRDKIVFVVADITATGGIERVITYLASYLCNNGYSVEILSIHRSNRNLPYPVHADVHISFVDKTIMKARKPGSVSKLLSHFKSSFHLNIKLFKRRKCIIVANSFPVALFSCFSALFSSKMLVVEHVHYHYYSKCLVNVRRFIYKFFYGVVALTERDSELYINDKLNSLTIPNALSSFPEKIANPSVEKKKIIAAGRLEHQKGFDILIKSFAEIDYSVRKEWIMDIYGDGNERTALQKLIHDLNIEDCVNLLGNSRDLMNTYAEYDFFVLSSRFEGFGMVLLEAMSCGLPCIAIDCPTGPREILDGGKYGILCDSQSNLGESIASLIVNKELRTMLSGKSILRSHDYNIQIISEKWHGLFESLNEKKYI